MNKHVVKEKEIIVLIIVSTIVIVLSSASLQSMTINVVTQSPFFLYENVVYDVSLLATLVITMLVRNRKCVLIPLITLWILILLIPYMIYIDSLPIYNDQLGFVSEAINGILCGHIKPVQGESSSLGHAYLTSILTIIMGIKPAIQGAIIVQSLLPFAYVIPLLALSYRDTKEMVLVILVILGTMLNPLFYGRTPFAWIFLILFTVLLYNELNKRKESNRFLHISAIIVLLIIYVAYTISDPTSLIIPIMLIVLSLFMKEFRILFLATAVTWFAINLVMYVSGNMSSLIAQVLAMIEAPANPVPSLAMPAVNPVMKLYNYAREFVVGIAYLIGLLSSLPLLRRGEFKVNPDLPWVILFMLFIAMQATALVMNRWGMVPYSMFVISVLPILVLKSIRNKPFQIVLTVLTMILITLSPVVKWGFSAIAFPTVNDVYEALFIINYIKDTKICASGSHEFLWFYFWFHNITASIINLNPMFTPNQANTCNIIAIFYRSFNIYRLDVTMEYLDNEINAMNAAFSVIYKNSFWTVWSK